MLVQDPSCACPRCESQLHEGDTAELSYPFSAGMGTKIGRTYPVVVQELTATHATVQDTEARGKPLTVPIAVVKLPAVGAGVLLLAAGRAGATQVAGGGFKVMLGHWGSA